MKICELIELLSKQDQEALVIVDGYEDGFDDVEKVELIEIAMREPKESKCVYGNHVLWSELNEYDKKTEVRKLALHIVPRYGE